MLSRAPGYDMRLITVNPGEALSINGTGIGPSLLTVVSGEVDCDLGEHQPLRMVLGQSLPIAPDQALPVYNPRPENLKMIQIMFLAEGEGRAVPLPRSAAPADSGNQRNGRPAIVPQRAAAHPEHGLAARVR